MKVEVIGKNGFTPSAANREYAFIKLRKVENFFGENADISALVVCKVYKEFHKVEVTIPTKHIIMRAEASNENLNAAIDDSIDKLMQQIRKHKTKIQRHLDREGIKAAYNEFDSESLEKELIAQKIVRSKEIELEPMTSDEAMGNMELLGHDFYIFLDIKDHKVKVMYLRKDGNYAIIETK